MKEQSSWSNYFIYLFSKIFNLLLIFAVVLVIGRDVLVAVERAEPSPSNSPRRVVVASVQHASQAQLYPIRIAAQQRIVGDDDAIDTQSSRPAVEGNLMVEDLSFLDSVVFREDGARRLLQVHAPLFGVYFPGFFEDFPIPTIEVTFNFPPTFDDVLLRLGESFCPQQTQPFPGLFPLYGQSGEIGSHHGPQVS